MVPIRNAAPRITFLLGLIFLAAANACAEPQNGWWWNPAESGRGTFIEARNGVMYLGGYLYDNDGRALWVVSGGPISDPYSYQGGLQTFRGGQSVFGEYRFPQPPADIGRLFCAVPG